VAEQVHGGEQFLGAPERGGIQPGAEQAPVAEHPVDAEGGLVQVGDDGLGLALEVLGAAADGVLLALAPVAEGLLAAGPEAGFLGVDAAEVADVLDGGGGDEGLLGGRLGHGLARPGGDEDFHALAFLITEGTPRRQSVGGGVGGAGDVAVVGGRAGGGVHGSRFASMGWCEGARSESGAGSS
jgi:hypothetical protein